MEHIMQNKELKQHKRRSVLLKRDSIKNDSPSIDDPNYNDNIVKYIYSLQDILNVITYYLREYRAAQKIYKDALDLTKLDIKLDPNLEGLSLEQRESVDVENFKNILISALNDYADNYKAYNADLNTARQTLSTNLSKRVEDLNTTYEKFRENILKVINGVKDLTTVTANTSGFEKFYSALDSRRSGSEVFGTVLNNIVNNNKPLSVALGEAPPELYGISLKPDIEDKKKQVSGWIEKFVSTIGMLNRQKDTIAALYPDDSSIPFEELFSTVIETLSTFNDSLDTEAIRKPLKITKPFPYTNSFFGSKLKSNLIIEPGEKQKPKKISNKESLYFMADMLSSIGLGDIAHEIHDCKDKLHSAGPERMQRRSDDAKTVNHVMKRYVAASSGVSVF